MCNSAGRNLGRASKGIRGHRLRVTGISAVARELRELRVIRSQKITLFQVVPDIANNTNVELWPCAEPAYVFQYDAPLATHAPIMSHLNLFPSLLRRATPWTCRSCQQQQRQQLASWRGFSHTAKYRVNSVSKRRRRIVLTAAGGTIAASAVALSDDAKHAVTAVRRTTSVVSTLAVCVNEYVSDPIPWGVVC